MCGIAGVVGGGGDVRRMTAALAHRGPDDERVQGVLGFRRLSIIDLAGGAQPMEGCAGAWLVLNGEIYNHRELRRRLEGRHAFRTRSDAEVVLHLWEDLGEGCVRELDGMFAFAVWDERTRTLFAARDRLGKKPFVYVHEGERFRFASEIAALEAPRRVDRRALETYLAFGYVPAPDSMIQGVRKLPPGHRLSFDGRSLRVSRWWEPRAVGVERSPDAWAERLVHALSRAVRKRLMADVPLGAFLSGGIDSSIVTGLMAQSGPVKTFSIGFREPEWDESASARAASARFRTEHRAFEVRPDSAEVLPLLVRRFGEPFGDASAIPTYRLSRETAAHVKVALSGDGGDELFLGYRRYEALARAARLRRWPAPLLAAGALALRPWRTNYGERVRRLLAGAKAPLGEVYAGLVSIFTPPMRRALGLGEPVEDLVAAPFAARAGGPAESAAWADLATYLPGDILTKVDIASMACGLEVRCPFLDAEVVDLALAMPEEVRMGKGVLRRAFRGLLPAELLAGPKRGFGVPLTDWLRGELRPLLEDALASLERRGLLEGKEIRRLAEEHRTGRADHRDRLYLLLVLELWLRTA
jgi:asparagine synthase (glutamine-hydrolysing)